MLSERSESKGDGASGLFSRLQWVSVTVHPRAGNNAIEARGPGRFDVWVKAKPVDGQATDAVIQLLAERLQIARQRFQLVKGRTGRKKLFRIVAQR